MPLVRLDDLRPRDWPAPAVTIGNFDGVHLGHQALVAAALRDARAGSGTCVVLTFDPHPSRVLSPDRAPSSLMTVEQKAAVLLGLGVGVVAVLPFSRELAADAPAVFARNVIAGALRARLVVVGANFRFGRHRAGDVTELERLGGGLGFSVEAIPPVLHEGAPISSSRIREALARGEVEAVIPLLGRRFSVFGRVVHGDGRGRSLGIPTANLAVENETLPRTGVYAGAVATEEGGPANAAVVNLGRRPTFGAGEPTLEAHLLDFQGDLYGRKVRLEFAARLRDERAFAGREPLVAQIHEDIAAARAYLRGPSADGV
jgi:riboflavin kinase / FMN adenylyltransferase